VTVHTSASVILLVAALALIAGAAAMATRGLRERRTAVQVAERAVGADAEVLELSAKDISVAGDPTTLYYPIVRFTPVDGEPVEAECLTGVEAPPPHVGELVAVRYDPEQPSHVELADADPLVSAGRSSFVVARVLGTAAAALPVAWLLLALLVW
jgi:ABC-type amino acid transport substrate-binding protein